MATMCVEEVSVDKDITIMTKDDHSTFVEIDRKQEDRDVVLYQKTGNKTLFEKLYKNRIPTLQIWARQYYYLMDSKEDMFGELSKYFAKAVDEYKKKKGSFNTCLFTFLINRIRNLNVGRNAKKRKPQFMDEDVKNGNFLFSLEYAYKDGKGEGINTLRDILPDPKAKKDMVIGHMGLEETIDCLSYGCPTVRGFLRKVSDGNTLSAIIKEYKTQKGFINVDSSLIKKLTARKNKSLVKNTIQEKANLDKFSVIDYHIGKSNTLHYTIELKKTKESAIILKAIRKLKKNKEFFLDRITGV